MTTRLDIASQVTEGLVAVQETGAIGHGHEAAAGVLTTLVALQQRNAIGGCWPIVSIDGLSVCHWLPKCPQCP